MKEIKIEQLIKNPYELFAKDWAILSAGNEKDGYNAMTIAWGTIGALWEKGSHSNRLPVLTVFVRPSRYTDTFMKEQNTFSVSVVNNKKIMGYLGSHSGRNENKYEATNLTPVFEENTVYPQEAELVLICRKIYSSSLEENNFIDKELVDFNYADHQFHNVYIGKIEKIYVK